MIKVFEEKKHLIKQLFLYGMIGGFAALVDFFSFYLFREQIGLNKFIANVISMHFGMLVSFSLNANFNFKKTDRILKRFLTYYIVILFGILLSTIILFLLSYVISSALISKAISIMIVSAIQFILNKKLTFKF